MAEITYLRQWTNQPIPPERVLEAARVCTDVLVLGWNEDGSLYAASSMPDSSELLWLMHTFQHKLLSGDYG